ncbi:ABC transporter ATP-binding protein [Clostridium botulinum]|uniref:ABC transporter ATP-binding protein n=1 Tax=unclassified Clostridium TaxID=2614128 RepID=UPI001D51B8E4|nr:MULTISPECIES: ABC transporter ATP-binding protein [unclassified Clostridium]MBN1040342.1 ABC transporter ATP-binding protein [Clostridium botulinum]MBN1047058.1 ABC transporter ATP-binding protein [Clostridium botulinum]MBN1053709.1 ABC transporter ATP-binding protein [Clostridium botulinum]
MDIIQLKNINKIYGKGESELIALKNIDLTIKKGEFLAIMGSSGSGKSTLLNIMGCMDIPTNGEYYLNNMLIKNLSNNELSKIRNSTVSFIFQHFALIKDYTVYDNIELPLLHRKVSSKEKKDLILKYSHKLGISDKLYKKPTELSGGQQQRVAICRALVSESQIILADEPTGALDSNTGKSILDLLKEINKEGKTIIIVTHDLKIASYCDRTIIINDGKINKN